VHDSAAQRRPATPVPAEPRGQRGIVPAAGGPLVEAALRLQRMAGNQAVGALLQRAPAPPAAPPGEQSITFQGVRLTKDPAQVRARLEEKVVDHGRTGADDFANAYLNLDLGSKMLLGPIALDLDPIIREQLTQLNRDNDDFIGRFQKRGEGITGDVLDNSEKNIREEMRRYGITWTENDRAGSTGREYHMANKDAADAIRKSARELAAKRRQADTLLDTYHKAREKLDDWLRNQPLIPFLVPQNLVDDNDQARGAWQGSETEYDGLLHDRMLENPVLGAFATGDGAASRLEELASQSWWHGVNMADALGKAADERLTNISLVRTGLGSTYSVWKLPRIMAMTERDLQASPMQSRLIADKVKSVEQKDGDTKMVVGLIALGLALVTLIPSGGSSIMAGISGLAALTGAAMTLGAALDKVDEQALQRTDFDKARNIAAGDPEMLWLALDLIFIVIDVGAATRGFEALSGLVREARAAKAAKAAADAEHADAVLEADRKIRKMFDAAEEVDPQVAKRTAGRLGLDEELANYDRAASEPPYAVLPNGAHLPPTSYSGGYHGTTLGPDVVLKDGLPAGGPNLNLLEHANPPPNAAKSAFRGTTQFVYDPSSGQGAAAWADEGGWVYEIRNVPTWDVNTALEGRVQLAGGYTSNLMRGEGEFAVLAEVPPDKIVRYGQVSQTPGGHLVVKHWTQNPAFKAQ
jgi:hypothetical protein